MPRIFKHLEAGCLQVNLMSTSTQINQLKYTILYIPTVTDNSGSMHILHIYQRWQIIAEVCMHTLFTYIPYSVVVEYCIFARAGIKSYKDGFCLKLSIKVFNIFYQKSPKIYLG